MLQVLVTNVFHPCVPMFFINTCQCFLHHYLPYYLHHYLPMFFTNCFSSISTNVFLLILINTLTLTLTLTLKCLFYQVLIGNGWIVHWQLSITKEQHQLVVAVIPCFLLGIFILSQCLCLFIGALMFVYWCPSQALFIGVPMFVYWCPNVCLLVSQALFIGVPSSVYWCCNVCLMDFSTLIPYPM